MKIIFHTPIFTICILMLFIHYSNRVYSFNRRDSVIVTKGTDPYILKLDTTINIKLNVNNEFERFIQEGDGYSYDIRPNISLSNRIGVNYRYISFGFGFKPKFIPGNNDNDEQGKTKAFSMGFNINGTHFLQSLQGGYVKGFYLHNSDDFTPGWVEGENPYIQLPDLKLIEFRGSTGYKFNPNFSIKAINSQTEIQLRSCGSFITSLSYMYYQTDNQSKSTTQTSSQKSNNFQTVASIGYFYTFVISSSWYTSAGLFPGAGINFTKLTTRSSEGNLQNSYNDPVFQIQERMGIGYNGRKFFAGSEVSLAQSKHNENHSSFQTQASRFYFQIFVGYRFTAPKFIKKETDQVKELVPNPIRNMLE